MRRLSGLDASFLYLETPSMHMHVASLAVFDPSTSPRPVTYERIVEVIRSRMHLVPTIRERLAEVPFNVFHPLWVEDPDFDVEYHVRRATLPAPGGDRELAALCGDISSRPLNRDKPLWELHIIEGLADGKIAMVTKSHHAAIDGVSGMDLAVAMLDLEPDPAPMEAVTDEWVPEKIPSDLELLATGIRSRLRQPLDAAKLGPSAVKSARTMVESMLPSRDKTGPPALFSAPRTSLNRALTPHRAFSYCSVPFADFKAIRAGLGGTVNDVVLAVCSATLRDYFAARGEELDESLVAMIPISVRTDEQAGTLGNQVSSMNTTLATDIADPVERLAAISAGTKDAKEQHDAIGADLITGLAEFAPINLTTRAARLYSRINLADRIRPPYNITISNVPGPQFPLYSAGAKMLATYPMGPLNEGAALNITVNSYDGDMMFGFHGCPEALDDIWFFPEAALDAIAELKTLAEKKRPATKRPATKRPAKKAATKKRAASAKKKAASRTPRKNATRKAT